MRVDIKNRKAIDRVHNITIKYPEEIAKAGHEIAKLYQRNLRLNITRKNLIWTKRLWNSVKAKEVSKFRSEVSMVNYGVMLDKRDSKFVPFRFKNGRLRSGSSIVRWAQLAPNSPFKGTRLGAGITVKRHPFIRDAFSRTISRMVPIIKRRAEKAMAGG